MPHNKGRYQHEDKNPPEQAQRFLFRGTIFQGFQFPGVIYLGRFTWEGTMSGGQIILPWRSGRHSIGMKLELVPRET